ncbi:unnamed protein product, partial [marine sediment metagenome]
MMIVADQVEQPVYDIQEKLIFCAMPPALGLADRFRGIDNHLTTDSTRFRLVR